MPVKTYDPTKYRQRTYSNRLTGGLSPLPSQSQTQAATPVTGTTMPRPVTSMPRTPRMPSTIAQQTVRAPQQAYSGGVVGHSYIPRLTVAEAMKQHHPSAWQNTSPQTARMMAGLQQQYGTYGTGVEQQVPQNYLAYAPGNPEQAAQLMTEAMNRSPEAMRHMDPQYAAWYQRQSELENIRQQQQRANEALAYATGQVPGVGQLPNVPQAPDVHDALGDPGYDPAHWERERRREEGEIRARFQGIENQMAEASRRGGMNRGYYETRANELQDAMQRQILQSQAALARRRDETRWQQSLDALDRRLGVYGTQAGLYGQQAQAAQNQAQLAANILTQGYPSAAESMTGMEDYLRGAGYEDQLMRQAADVSRQGQAPASRDVGGGGGFSKPFGGGEFGGIVGYPHGTSGPRSGPSERTRAAQWARRKFGVKNIKEMTPKQLKMARSTGYGKYFK